MIAFSSFAARFALSLAVVTGASVAAAQQAPVAEQGVPGTVYPQSVDVRVADSLVNQDDHGGTNQVLLSIAASPGAGFATVWRDQRDGMLGLYLARTNASGEELEPERPIHQPHSGRRLEPAVALGKDNSGAVVWMGAVGRGTAPWVRTFDSEGKWLSPDRLLIPADNEPRTAREPSRLPAIGALPQGGYAVAWTHTGQVKYQEIDRDGTPRGKLIRLAPSSPPAEPGVHLAVGSRGAVLCVWRNEDGNIAVNHSRSDTSTVNCGMGVLCRLIADPVGGFWGAFLVDGRAVLRHLSVEGRPDRPEIKPLGTEFSNLDLALGDDFIALLAEVGKAPRVEPRAEKKPPRGGARGGNAGGGRSNESKDRGAGMRTQAGDASTATVASSGAPIGASTSRVDTRGGTTATAFDAIANAIAMNGDTIATSAGASATSSDAITTSADAIRANSRAIAMSSGAVAMNNDAIGMNNDAIGMNNDAIAALDVQQRDPNAPPDASTPTDARDKSAARTGEQGDTGSSATTTQTATPTATDGKRAGDGSAASFTVYLFDRDGRERESSVPIRVPTDVAVSVRGPRLACNGKRILVAWTDQRNGDQDVYGRVIDPSAPRSPGAPAGADPRLGAELRLNTDFASSDQNNPRIAGAGNFAVIAWQDARDNVHHAYARRVGPDGFTGDEFLLPAKFGDSPMPPASQSRIQPTVAMQSNGEFAVQWKEPRGESGTFRVQLFAADGRALGAPQSIDTSSVGSVSDVITALGPDRGYAISWIRGNRGGLWTRRLSSDGKLGTATLVAESKDGDLGDLAAAALDDGRTVLVWDFHTFTDSWSLRARFVDAANAPTGDEISFELTARRAEWQPCVAPAANNGFVLGWTSGSPNDPSHDVVARVYDSRGEPAGPLLPISCLAQEQDYSQIVRMPDKSYVITWEDDISFYDHTYLRRINANGRELGTVVRMNELETKSVEDRTGPVLAVIGDGIVGAWNDRRRSQGWDIYLRILGPKFDDVRKH